VGDLNDLLMEYKGWYNAKRRETDEKIPTLLARRGCLEGGSM